MAEAWAAGVRLTVSGLEVEAGVPLHAGTLRYFEPGGPFAAAVAAATGAPLPAPLTAALLPTGTAGAAGVILAWLRPTETLVLSEEARPLAELEERLGNASGGQLVDLSGGLAMLRLRGTRTAELLCRLGGAAVG